MKGYFVMKFNILFTVILFPLSVSFPQSIHISGMVKDNSTHLPIVGATVHLSGHGLIATTDSEGKFAINSTSTLNGIPIQASISVLPTFSKDGTIRFSLSYDACVLIQTYSLQGKSVSFISEKLKAGSYRIPSPIQTSGIYLHYITINKTTYTIQQMKYGNCFLTSGVKTTVRSFIGSENLLGKKQAAVEFPDTLRIRHELYARDVEVFSSETTNFDIGILSKKHRVINTTDLMADVDDEESLVRLMVSSNEFDLPGIPVTTSCWRTNQNQEGMNKLVGIVNAYKKCYDNLKVHTKGNFVPDFMTPEEMEAMEIYGQTGYGMADVGNGKDSKGSDLIIEEAFKENDPRPLWVTFWGGTNTLAQALIKVKTTKTEVELEQFLKKVKVYDVLGQDDAGAWIAKTYPNLVYIRAQGVYNWQQSDEWYQLNVQSKGELGKVYPTKKYAWEGDTPAFLYLFNYGLSDPCEIDWGSWGGRFSWRKGTNNKCMSGNSTPSKQVVYQPFQMHEEAESSDKSKWKDDLHNDFAARMIWSTTSDYSKVNHHPVAVINSDSTRHFIEIKGQAGKKVALDASGSFDPDGNNLSFNWELFKEPSTLSSLGMEGSNSSKLAFTIPSESGKEAHIILHVTDNGSPKLTMYRRIILTVE